MYQKTDIVDIYRDSKAFENKEITVCGWIRTLRDSKTLGFIEINDGSCFKGLQVVFEEGKVENFAEITKLNVGSAIVVKGILILTPQAKQPFEIHASDIYVRDTA